MESNSLSAKEKNQLSRKKVSHNMPWIPGGTFTMDSDLYYPEEGPGYKVAVETICCRANNAR
jgi:hypothetical protein